MDTHEKIQHLTFRPAKPITIPRNRTLYLAVTYLDDRYGHIAVHCAINSLKAEPDLEFRGWLEKTGQQVTALYRLRGDQAVETLDGQPTIIIGYERSQGNGLVVLNVKLQAVPFADSHFQ